MTQAADIVGVNKSTLSRYLEQHPSLVRQRNGKAKLVDPDEVKAHRERHVNPAMAGNHAGRLQGDDAGDDEDDDAPAPGGGDQAASGGLTAARTDREKLKAQRERIAFARELGQIVDRAAVESMALSAATMVRERLAIMTRRVAERLAALRDAREVAAVLNEEHAAVLKALAEALRDEATEGRDDHADAA
ncbi:MAG: hypothetical protein AB7H93_23555 [Vicinamibacterales bacterium]